MFKFLLASIIVVALFFSGKVPYSLVYDKKTLDNLINSNEPIEFKTSSCTMHVKTTNGNYLEIDKEIEWEIIKAKDWHYDYETINENDWVEGEIRYGQIAYAIFSGSIINNTNRFVIISLRSDVSRTDSFRYDGIIMFPNENRSFEYQLKFVITHEGKYQCQVDWNIGRAKF